MKHHQDSKQAIIRAGREMLAITSLSDLSVRRLVEHARVNHGLFHYYFKTKEKFYAEVVKDLFDSFNATASGSPVQYKDPVEQLRALLIGFALFLRENWGLLWPVLKDNQLRDLMRNSIRDHLKPHMEALRRTVKACRERKMLVVESDTEILNMLFLFSVGPIILHGLGTEIMPNMMKEYPIVLDRETISTEAIYKRIDMALKRVLKVRSRR